MFRFIALVTLIACFSTNAVAAESPSYLLIVAADQPTASLIRPPRRDARLSVLIHDENDSFELINARALAVRFATHVVYDSSRATTLSEIFRERLQNHGAIPIDLRAASQPIRLEHKATSTERSIVQSRFNSLRFSNNTD